ncbi:MAG: hypothetical protein IPL61_18720 [Myxococcales bacterium]|nr:hypothetical protein [Myxococcales bacterium]
MSVSFVPVAGAVTGSVAYDATNHYVASSGLGTWTVAIPVEAFTKIRDITVEVYGNGACAITVDAIRADAAGVNTFASASATPGASYTTIAISEATIAANWTVPGQTISGLAAMLLKFTFSASGGRVRRISILGDRV